MTHRRQVEARLHPDWRPMVCGRGWTTVRCVSDGPQTKTICFQARGLNFFDLDLHPGWSGSDAARVGLRPGWPRLRAHCEVLHCICMRSERASTSVLARRRSVFTLRLRVAYLVVKFGSVMISSCQKDSRHRTPTHFPSTPPEAPVCGRPAASSHLIRSSFIIGSHRA